MIGYDKNFKMYSAGLCYAFLLNFSQRSKIYFYSLKINKLHNTHRIISSDKRCLIINFEITYAMNKEYSHIFHFENMRNKISFNGYFKYLVCECIHKSLKYEKYHDVIQNKNIYVNKIRNEMKNENIYHIEYEINKIEIL